MKEPQPPWSRLRPLPVVFVIGLFFVLWWRQPSTKAKVPAAAPQSDAVATGDVHGKDPSSSSKTLPPAADAAVTSRELSEEDGLSVLALSGVAMGTTWNVRVVGRQDATDADTVGASIVAALDAVDKAMSTYRPDSELSQLNRLAGGKTMQLSPATATVLAAALRLSEQSEGAFDVTVGPLVRAWGFAAKTTDKPPSADVVKALRERVGFRLVDLDPESGRVTKRVDGVEIDLSAIAKGYAVDMVAAALTAAGHSRFLIEVGGEVVAAGLAPGERAWRLGVERPDADPGTVQEVALMTSGALATSGDYRNVRVLGGKRYSHTIDPRTGAPVKHALASVSVRAKTCTEADGMATTLAVLGPTAGMAFAHRLQVAAFFLVRRDDGSFDQRATPQWQAANDLVHDHVPPE
jgi:FAD:protein FMN transferase